MKQLKRILIQRPEPLLLIVPLILFGLVKLFAGDSALNLPGQQAGNLLQLDSSILFWIVFAFVMVPFLLHFLLRASGKWDAAFCRPHVYLTIALLILMFIAFYGNSQTMPNRYFSDSAGGKVADAFNFNKTFGLIFFIELLIQFFFTVFFLIRIFQKESKYLRPKDRIHSPL